MSKPFIIADRREDGRDYVEVLNHRRELLFCHVTREKAAELLARDNAVLAPSCWANPVKAPPLQIIYEQLAEATGTATAGQHPPQQGDLFGLAA